MFVENFALTLHTHSFLDDNEYSRIFKPLSHQERTPIVNYFFISFITKNFRFKNCYDFLLLFTLCELLF